MTDAMEIPNQPVIEEPVEKEKIPAPPPARVCQ